MKKDFEISDVKDLIDEGKLRFRSLDDGFDVKELEGIERLFLSFDNWLKLENIDIDFDPDSEFSNLDKIYGDEKSYFWFSKAEMRGCVIVTYDVGFVGIRKFDNGISKLLGPFVKKQRRNKGIEEALVFKALMDNEKCGNDKILVEKFVEDFLDFRIFKHFGFSKKEEDKDVILFER